MPFSAGVKLGPYKILAPIGAGGMGEVWKAHDSRLNRIVAIKTSKARFSERFAREARAIAALNHPHVCQIYDVGPDYLVMEYLDGSHLQCPVPAQKAVEYAGQILSALDAAHTKGIVHRDLKPANILVTKQHGIKLVDFGLARHATGPVDSTLTQPGEKIGTPAYMAPEQWEGKPCDARTDIYCFGCVLYEMLTGKRAVQEELVPVEPAQPGSIVRTCLEQAPEDRWQTARDIWRAMTLPSPPAPPRSRTWQGVAAIALVSLGLVLFWGGRSGPALSGDDVVSFAIYPPEKNVFSSHLNITLNVPQFAVAPDGRAIVFVAGAEGERPMLWRRPIDDARAQALSGTEDAQDPFWSPDSRWIGFFSEGKLKKVSAVGGAVQVILSGITDARGATWGNDDTILLANGSDPIQRVTSAGGQPVPLGTLGPDESSHRYPHFLPDGHHFLYISLGPNGQASLYSASLEDRGRQLAARIRNNAVYAAPGYLLFAEADTLFGQSFDARRLRASGQQFHVAEHVGHSTTHLSAVSASATGVIAYAGTLSPKGTLTWFDRAGQPGDSPVPEGYYSDFRLSPNEKSLAASLLNARTGAIEVWITDLTRGSIDRVAREGASINATPIWSPDGAQLVFRTFGGVVEFYQRSAFGGGDDQVVLSDKMTRAAGLQSTSLVNTDWSPDGKSILFSPQNPTSGRDIWLLPLTGNKKPVKLLASAADEMHGNFSPDGRLIAYTTNESGKFQVNVQTLSLSNRTWHVSTNGGSEPRWRADGREIYYLSHDKKLMAVAVGEGPSFGIPRVLFQTRVPTGVTATRTHYVPSRDGKRFLINTQSVDTPSTPITVVTNWAATLKK
jgi:Tol biopolymer transport system component/predicted Ser/Thr protein kinase